MIHGPKFLRDASYSLLILLQIRTNLINQYERFWERPLETHIMWVGKLFGLLAVSLLYQRYSDSAMPNNESLIQAFGEKIIQCLVLGKYQDCPPDTIETLCFYLNVQFLQTESTQMDLIILFSVIVRLAQRMGYHRDARHFPHISVFEGEMRRRMWTLITDMDTLASSRVGLPRLLREFQSDTALPQNLLDEDFDEDTTELPPSRSNSFDTPVQHLITKNKLVSMFGIITDFATSIRRPSYAEVMHLDDLLHETYKSVPEKLRERPLRQSLMDEPDLILRRMQQVIILEKARCVLHYRYLAPARTDRRYAYSRETCIEASLHILDYHCILDQEIQPGGRLYHERWKLLSLIKTEFLLATTLLCLELNYDLSSSDFKKISLSKDLVTRISQALQKSYDIRMRGSSELSAEARKATQAVEVVLEKLRELQSRGIPFEANDSSSASWAYGSPPTGKYIVRAFCSLSMYILCIRMFGGTLSNS